MNIAITGGGTGGHLAIAKALKEELNKRGLKPIYIGSSLGQDKSWFEEDEGFEACYFLNSKGVVNKKGIKKLFVLFDIFKEALKCRTFLKNTALMLFFVLVATLLLLHLLLVYFALNRCLSTNKML